MDAKSLEFQLKKEFRAVKPGKKLRTGKDRRFCSSLIKSCALNSRWVLWSNTVFFLGNICYIALDVMDLRTAEADEPLGNDSENAWFLDQDLKVGLSFLGAFLFLANPISDFMGTWAEEKVLEIHEKMIETDSQTLTDNAEELVEEEESDGINYDKVVAIIFFFGSLIYLYLALLDWKNPESTLYEPVDIFASHLFVVDAFIGLIGWNVNRLENIGTPTERQLFHSSPYKIDWSGYGDWSFFFGSIIDAAISYTEAYPLTVQAKLSLFSDGLWLFNSILYTVGYLYGQDVRRRFASKYYTSLYVLSNEKDEPTAEVKRTELPYTIELL